MEMSKEESLEIYFSSLIMEIKKDLIKYLRCNSIFKLGSLLSTGIFRGEQRQGLV